METAARRRRALATYRIAARQLPWLTYEARRRPEGSSAAVSDATRQEAPLGHFRPPADGPPPTLREAVRPAARRGGFWNRRGDGEPGVKCLWRGWHELPTLTKGYRLRLQ